MRHELLVPTHKHVYELSATMRQADVEEVWALYHLDPELALYLSIGNSCWSYAGLIDGRVIAIFGVGAIGTFLTEKGVPWALVSEYATDYPISFLRFSRVYLERMKNEFSELVNIIDARNVKAIEWLKWLGFEIMPTIPAGVERREFHPFRMET